ncbi:transcriptional regulator [Terriglobus aquaticus]|uniref:Transcriptional regulator n=1 Tax=Terriglobus aquaticus TaxID=940139 RepID=A0ABW9KLD1_9BACT|nr:transcriptional regulator [Terriglobus aquaticus]
MNPHSDLLQRELWSSWAGVLRSYAAVHSLGRDQHAVVEVSEAEILLRYGSRWMRFTHDHITSSQGAEHTFALTENGRARIDNTEDEMDLSAERLAREIITL